MFFYVVHLSFSTSVLFGSDTIIMSQFSLLVFFSRTSWATLALFKMVYNILSILLGIFREGVSSRSLVYMGRVSLPLP